MEPGVQPWALAEPSAVDVSLDSVAEASREARHLIDGLGYLVPSSVLADLRTVVSELVNNCVAHGTGEPIDVCIDVTPGGDVRGRVGDLGCAPVGVAPPRAPGDGGLGLRIVDVVASRWGVCSPSSDVWFELRAPMDPRRRPRLV
jgi:anti-sigma regulatory factor (Ser/Thr protein kinase)